MKSISGLVCALILDCISCSGQTNGCTTPSVRFFSEPVHLRTEARPATDKTKELAPARQIPPASAEGVSLETALGDGQFHSRVVRDGEFYLRQTTARSDSPVARFVDDVFRPELIHLGKVTLSCPIVTVIKRKNPLSLLSAISTQATPTGDGQIDFKFLELSW